MKKVWHIFLAAVNLILAVLMLMSAYGGTVSPESSVIPALVAMMLPLLLPLMLVAMVISFFISWKAAIFNIVVLMCCSGPILNICPLNFDTKERFAAAPADTRFSIMTYNVMELKNYYNRDSIDCTSTVEFMINSGCDMIAYQEAYNLHSPQYPHVSDSSLVKLRETYPYIAYSKDSYLGLLSKFPVKRVPINIADTKSFFVDCYEADVHGTTVTIVNVHMQSIGLNNEDKDLYSEITRGNSVSMDTLRHTLLHKLKAAFKARARQAIKLRHYINDLKGPLIVCGDFNDIPGCYAERAIMGHDLRDSYRDAALGPAITYHANRFYFRIDQILYRGITPLKVSVTNGGFSDHYPVAGIFSTIPELKTEL